jgi:hypothetical protein
MRQIFEFNNHYSYLRYRLEEGVSKRGIKAQFSHFLRIQPAFLSQVLARKYALSLEQACLGAEFFDLASDETEFLLLLVSLDRAGTPALRKHFQRQIDLILKKRKQVIERLGKASFEISEEAKGIYYSSWVYSGIHVGCTIPRLRSRKAIADYLELPLPLAGKVLDFLVENFFLAKSEDAYLPTAAWARLDKESPHIIKHHTSWRQKAIQNFEVQTDEDLHYSGVFSMDERTAVRIKDRFLDFLKDQLKEIKNAKEEDLFSVGVDCFRISKPR